MVSWWKKKGKFCFFLKVEVYRSRLYFYMFFSYLEMGGVGFVGLIIVGCYLFIWYLGKIEIKCEYVR